MTTTTTTVATSIGNDMQLVRVTPSHGTGPWPAVLFCIDAGGLRDTMAKMAQRIADESNVVVVMPDLFFAAGSIYELLPPGAPHTMGSVIAAFSNAEFAATWRARIMAPTVKLSHLRVIGEAVLGALAADPDVRPGPIGTTGYCMGGHVSLKVAALFSARVSHGASFHAGGLVNDTPESLHRMVAVLGGRQYIAGAKEDGGFTEANRATLDAALAEAKRDYTLEMYDARHGFAVDDHPAFDVAAAERHYAATRELFSGLAR